MLMPCLLFKSTQHDGTKRKVVFKRTFDLWSSHSFENLPFAINWDETFCSWRWGTTDKLVMVASLVATNEAEDGRISCRLSSLLRIEMQEYRWMMIFQKKRCSFILFFYIDEPRYGRFSLVLEEYTPFWFHSCSFIASTTWMSLFSFLLYVFLSV